MSDADKQVVKEFVDAFIRGDLDDALSRLADDAIVDEADGMDFSGRFTGPAGFAKLIEKMSAGVEARIDSNELIDGGHVIVSRLEMTFTSTGSGRSLPTRVTEIYTVRDGRIVGLDSFYKDPLAVNALYNEK
ncbi:nuclear transport factor 2 family protein [Pseudonocardia sp. N23]|uniref:nuclear transport factor 2 family protein n=1 Tax=Pseudonocardia sp. N23 TaxID=1987376 RepID=UPI000BFC74AA|nr:nuclear transport factor 2 family protein [Pseudonocardia sp. N23]GAY07247.1 hypothetical protein TOK_2472 [Pseudonocardia sp. N23]